jgi:hypothetical protein
MCGIDKARGKYARLFKGVEDIKARWRGAHTLGTSEIRSEDWPTTEEVIERGTDISDRVPQVPRGDQPLLATPPPWQQLRGLVASEAFSPLTEHDPHYAAV